ncbi:MAG: hypothetical protein ABIA76_02640 [Candidatus Diapherotrites archaeon]
MNKLFLFVLIFSFIAFACIQEKNISETQLQEVAVMLNQKYNKEEIPSVEVIYNVEELVKQKRIIYENAENGMLLVQWSDLLVIYDYKKEEIVKELPIGGVNLG